MTNPRTIARLEARILQRAAYCVQFELSDPRLALVTLTKCELSNDLGSAKLSYSVFGSDADQRRTQRALEDAAGFVQRQVARVLETRKVPRVSWIFDESIRKAAEMDRTIREALERDRAVNPGAHPDLAGPPEPQPEVELDELAEAELVEDEYEEFLEDDEAPK
jgi:ribosome-binding factor A